MLTTNYVDSLFHEAASIMERLGRDGKAIARFKGSAGDSAYYGEPIRCPTPCIHMRVPHMCVHVDFESRQPTRLEKSTDSHTAADRFSAVNHAPGWCWHSIRSYGRRRRRWRSAAICRFSTTSGKLLSLDPESQG